MTTIELTEAELIRRIKVLSERVWEGKCRSGEVDRWLANFDGSVLGDEQLEQLHALHLLSRVSYFGLIELRVLLRSMFRDHFRYPLLQQLRRQLGGTVDVGQIRSAFDKELEATRFLGMGNPAESGTHLLYYFRQVNGLPKDLFVQQQALLDGPATNPATRISPPHLKRLVFVDDLCGSGVQSVQYSKSLLEDLQDVATRDGRALEFEYLVLFGTKTGLEVARNNTRFARVSAVNLLDETDQTFGPTSRVFRKTPFGIDKLISRTVAHGYGQRLWPPWPLGYGDRQLLLAFHHNVPDNTLPIIWHDESPSWQAVLPRYHKVTW